MPRVIRIAVIEEDELFGRGTHDDISFRIKAYYDLKGNLIAYNHGDVISTLEYKSNPYKKALDEKGE